ncbi:hypothetical protein ACKI1I_11625 [Streptomyces turgidiscabies]|uniref:Uncharacterized protein n=1 Tax=Streptomyces turgidiscabies (strain Car8) TaxID=698760 RepID=L7EV39_STRT8|nr:hypothetical protein STRTUCAR8_03269 [Streptomyces turgidiscabies Car8]GAQ74637.1 hypothetical protein T45_06417 [Streptomyces turgidiscabies]
MRRVYAEGACDSADFLATEDQDRITRLHTMLGGLVLARATKDSPLSDLSGEILVATAAGGPPGRG